MRQGWPIAKASPAAKSHFVAFETPRIHLQQAAREVEAHSSLIQPQGDVRIRWTLPRGANVGSWPATAESYATVSTAAMHRIANLCALRLLQPHSAHADPLRTPVNRGCFRQAVETNFARSISAPTVLALPAFLSLQSPQRILVSWLSQGSMHRHTPHRRTGRARVPIFAPLEFEAMRIAS